MSESKKLMDGLLWLILSICILVGSSVLVSYFCFNWGYHSVLSGSMHPTIMQGSLVISKPVDQRELSLWDIVVFNTSNQVSVVHRIEKILEEGVIVKGDANPSPDKALVLFGEIEGIVILSVPYLGRAVTAIGTTEMFLLSYGVLLSLYIRDFLHRPFKKKGEPVFQFSDSWKNGLNPRDWKH